MKPGGVSSVSAGKLQGFAAIEADLHQGDLAQIYLLHGENRVGIADALIRLEGHFQAQDEHGWARTTFAGDETPAGPIAEEVGTSSLFGGERLVVVAQFDAMPAAEQETLARWMTEIPPRGCLVLVADKLDRKRNGVKQFLQIARVVGFPVPGQNALPGWVQARAKGYGVKPDRAAVERLLQLVGPDLMALDTELAKLASYLGDETQLTAAVVEEAASRAIAHAAEYAVFHLADAVVEGRDADALRILEDLVGVGRPPLVLLTLIARQFRMVLSAGDLAARGERSADIAAHLGVKPFVAQKAMRQAHRVPPQAAAAALELLLSADLRIKNSEDGRRVLEEVIVRLSHGVIKSGAAVST